MSEYGPAFFIKRKDKKEIKPYEREKLLEQVIEIAKDIDLKTIDGDDAVPEFYDYDEYEEKAVSFLIYASFVLRMMSEAVQKEQEAVDAEDILKIGEALDKIAPDTYEYTCYFVEN